MSRKPAISNHPHLVQYFTFLASTIFTIDWPMIQNRGLRHTLPVTPYGGAENDGHENDGPSKLQGMKLQGMKLQDMARIDSILFNCSFFLVL